MYQRYLYLSKLNAVLLPENETFEPSVKKKQQLLQEKQTLRYFETFSIEISLKPLLQKNSFEKLKRVELKVTF